MAPPEDPLGDVKAALATRFAAVDGVAAALDYEPLAAPALPLVSVMTAGFRRRQLESPEISGEIGDPLMGRRWVWPLRVRVWVALLSDAEASQKQLDALIPRVVRALESDATLGGVAVDASLISGDVELVRPREGQPVLMLDCTCEVETEENLT